MLTRQSAEPLYAQVEKLLRERIGRHYRPGQLLPTQQQIATETGASLITVKRALAELTRRGLVESTRGRGTVVRRTRVADNHADVSSWTESIAGLGTESTTAWTKIVVRVPPPTRARLLGLKARQRSVKITRLRLVDGEPICLTTSEIPHALVPDLADRGLERASLYACLAERYGLRPAWAEEEVRARRATAAERKAFGGSTRIVVVVRRQTMLPDGRPLEFARIVAPADRYRYRVRLSAAGSPKPKERR